MIEFEVGVPPDFERSLFLYQCLLTHFLPNCLCTSLPHLFIFNASLIQTSPLQKVSCSITYISVQDSHDMSLSFNLDGFQSGTEPVSQ
jgi:hypothetical protein